MKDIYIKQLSELRRQRLLAGVNLYGVTCRCDAEGLAYLRSAAACGVPVQFKSSGAWVTLQPAQVQALLSAADLFVQECYSRERELTDFVHNATEPELRQCNFCIEF